MLSFHCSAVLLGPIRALSYLFAHGLEAATLGALWRWRVHWGASMAAGILVRVASQLGGLLISSWAVNENLFALLLESTTSLLERLLGAGGAPHHTVILTCIGVIFLINALVYVALMHLLYLFMLQRMGFRTTQLPAALLRRVGAAKLQ